MNDITALMATMKAAAEKATPGEWHLSNEHKLHIRDEDGIWLAHVGYFDSPTEVDDGEFIAIANPANVKTLVEALEKTQQHEQQWKSLCEAAAVDLDDWREIDDKSRGLICKLADAVIAKSERISSLESRTVTVKLPAEYLNADGSVNADMANTCPVVSEYREAHRAAGIRVIRGEGQ